MTTFNDIFKSSFMDNISSFSLTDAIIGLAFAFAVGMFIFLTYKKSFSGVMYSSSFALTLPSLAMVTTLVIMAVTSNVVLSLGMVGALSIVRFRTAIKDPIDTVFMFWAIAEGIVLGAGFYLAAIVGAILIGVFMLLLASSKKKASLPYLLILHYEERASKQIKAMVAQIPYARVKSKTVQRQGIELAVELRVRSSETGFVDKFLRVDGVYDATLIAHQGDMIS